MARSHFYARRYNFQRALAEAKKAVQLAPDYAAAIFDRGVAYNFVKQYDLALRDLSSAIELDTGAIKPLPGWPRAPRLPRDLAGDYGWRGKVYETTGDHDRALADYQEAICLDPDKATWWIDLGDLHQHQSNFRQAMYDYNQAILVEPDNPLCWLGLARLLKQAGQCDDAMAAVSTFFDPSKPNLLALLLRGDIYRCQGDIQRAISDYTQATRLEPSNALIWLDLANLYKEAKHYDKAESTISRVLNAEPGNLQARILRANLYHTLGAAHKAIAEASEAVRMHPDRAEAYSERAAAYNLAKQYQNAIADADRAIQINPRDFDACLQRGFAYLQLNNYYEAVGDVTEGLKLLTSAPGIKLTSADARIFNSVAWLLATCPDPSVRDGARATEYIDRALQLAPDQWESWDTRAAVFAENGDFENAVSWEERCLQRNDLSDEQRRRASERLGLYRAGKPYREEPK